MVKPKQSVPGRVVLVLVMSAVGSWLSGCHGEERLIAPPSPGEIQDLERSLATPAELLGVVPPRPIEGACPAPTYDPPGDFQGDLTAVAILEIDAQGGVQTVSIAEPSALPAFDEAVLHALSAWRFEAATRDGRPLPCRQRIRVRHGGVGGSAQEAGPKEAPSAGEARR